MEGKDSATLRYKKPELSAKAESDPPGLQRRQEGSGGRDEPSQPGFVWLSSLLFLPKQVRLLFLLQGAGCLPIPLPSPGERLGFRFLFRQLRDAEGRVIQETGSQREALPANRIKRGRSALDSSGQNDRAGTQSGGPLRAWCSKGYSVHPVLATTGTHASQVGTFNPPGTTAR